MMCVCEREGFSAAVKSQLFLMYLRQKDGANNIVKIRVAKHNEGTREDELNHSAST